MENFTGEIEAQALKYSVDPAVIKAIIHKESAWEPNAVRYEEHYKWLYQPEVFSKHVLISNTTEIITQKMSWGLGQIMGALAREQGHKGLMPELLDPRVNIMHICIRVQALMKRCKRPEEIFACYNGGFGALKTQAGKFKNEDYVVAAMRHLIKYKSS